MGRHFAGHGFLSAFVRYSSSETVTGFVRNDALGQEFRSLVGQFSPDRASNYIVSGRFGGLKQIGCLFNPSPISARQAWVRDMNGPRSWSLCGVNHTLSSTRVMDGITELLTAPIQPWDAIICTSRASREVIGRLLDRQAEYLSRRLGATRLIRPQLPVIPLGVDCAAHAGYAAVRDRARAEFGLSPEDVVVLFLGRLSFHAKANPAPMYMALERLAKKHRLVLIECGWFANEPIAEALAQARARLCPSVRCITLDGRKAENRATAWGAADIFCSLSDNIQETFGLTPIEAMAAGLPVVVTDWDGYKDTVRNGIDGFCVPTLAAPPGAGLHIAARHALEIDSYDTYIGQASSAVVVDIDATTAAFDRLASDPDLRRRMGAAGAARAREVFDWQVVIRAYERLWKELADLRMSGGEAPSSPAQPKGNFWPARPDPFGLFASFPSSLLSDRHRVMRAPGLNREDVTARLALTVTLANASLDLSDSILLELWEQIGTEWTSVTDALAARPKHVAPAVAVRGLLLLAKFDLLRIAPPEQSA